MMSGIEMVDCIYHLFTAKLLATVLGIGFAVFIFVFFKNSRQRSSPLKKDFEEGIVYLYQFPRVKYFPNLSPFCLKLETWLRMCKIKYENVSCSSTRSREGTLPFIEYNGIEYVDSSFIIRDLTELLAVKLDAHLDMEMKSIARAFEHMAEYSLFNTILRFRYIDHIDKVFDQLQKDSLGIFQLVLLWLEKKKFPAEINDRLNAIGIGKHNTEEIANIGIEDLRAISVYLGSKFYLLGFKPTQVDASVFSVLAQIIYAPYDLPHKKVIVKEFPNLIVFCNRIRDRFWPDWKDCTERFIMNSHIVR